MHNNTNYHGWNKALTFGVGSIQLSFRTLCSPNTCKDVFNPNVTAEGLHFSAFHSLYGCRGAPVVARMCVYTARKKYLINKI